MTTPTPQPTRGISIRLFLADGTPSGLTLVDRLGWTGHALTCSRSQFTSVRRDREELGRTALYVLAGATDTGFGERVYVGEGDAVGERIASHLRDKDFWDRLIVFTSTDANLNKAHVRYIEARLLQVALAAKRSDIDNSAKPEPSAFSLSEPEQAYAESFLDEMLLIFPLLQVEAFRTRDEEASRPDETVSSPVLRLEGKGAKATGREEPRGFVVYAGSTAAGRAANSTPGSAKETRKRLQDSDVLVKSGADLLRFTEDYVFNSPSHAAGVVLGNASNGRAAWVSEAGTTLRDLQAMAVETDDE